VNTYSEVSFKEHCAGFPHQSNVAELEWAKEAAEPKRMATAEANHGVQHNPTARNFSICQVKCSSELDLNNHLKGRRHQKNTLVLRRESKETEWQSGFREAELYEKKELQLVKSYSLLTWTKDPSQDGTVASARLTVHLSLTWRATSEAEGTNRL
jgi:hypothetical protein